MKKVVEKRIVTDLNIKAVYRDAENFFGIAKLSGEDENRYTVYGFCTPLMINSGSNQIVLDKSNTFFYEESSQLAELYHRTEVPGRLKQEKYIDRGSGDNDTFYMIPTPDLNLGENRKDVISIFEELLERDIQDFVREMKKWYIEGDAQELELIQRMLGSFPRSLEKEANERGHFYSHSHFHREEKFRSQKELPRNKTISTPMGGLPKWAREFQRKCQGWHAHR
jgi:hypothetical protein